MSNSGHPTELLPVLSSSAIVLAGSQLSRAIGLAESIEHDSNQTNGARAVASEIAVLIRAAKGLLVEAIAE